MITPRRRWLQRLAAIAAAIIVVWLPVSPASAAPGEPMCYVSNGKPYIPPVGSVGGPTTSTPSQPIVPCREVAAYTQPSTFLGGDGSAAIVDVEGNDLDSYYFDTGYRGMMDSVSNMDVKIPTMVANWIFEANKAVVWLACWLLGVTINFGVSDALLSPATSIATAYQTKLVDRIGLTSLALMVCTFWFGLAALRGRVGKGVGEILLSFCLAAIAGVVLAAPADTVLGDNGLLGTTRDVGVTVAALPMDDADAPSTGQLTPATIIGPFQKTAIDAFVRKPHQQLAYGVVFDDTGTGAHPCRDTYNKVLKTDAEDSDDAPMFELMKQCDPKLAENLRQNTSTRIIGSLLVLISSLIMLFYVLVAVVFPLIGAQIALAALAVMLVIALPVSLFGGWGRRALWLWVGATTTVLSVVVVSFASLSFFLLTAQALTQVEGAGFLLRLLLVDLIAIVLLACHRRLGRSAATHTRTMARRLDRAKIGGSGMGAMGAGGRWSVRGTWRDVRQLGHRTSGAYQRGAALAQDFRTGFNRGAGRSTGDDDGGAGGGYQRGGTAVLDRPRAAAGRDCSGCGGSGTVSVYLETEDDWDDRECPDCGGSGNA